MAYQIVVTALASMHLSALSAHDRKMVEEAIVARLMHQPGIETKAIKKLRPNPLAQYELRAGAFRILYNIEAAVVTLLVVGRKVGNKLIVQGVEFHGHEDNPTQQPGKEPG